MTFNGTKVQTVPIFDTHIKSLDGELCEEVEFTGSKLADFTTVRRPDMNQRKLKYSHTKNKRFYVTSTGEHQVQLILGHGIYSKIKTERVFKGHPGEPLVEETTSRWVVHAGDEYESGNSCMYMSLMTMRNYTVWMYWESRTGERMINCVTLKRVL